MEVLQTGFAVLLVWRRADAARVQALAGEVRERSGRAPRVECAERLAGALDAAAFDAVVLVDKDADAPVLVEVLKALRPHGVLVWLEICDPTSPASLLTLHGFVDVSINKTHIVAHKPSFEPGARRALRGAAWHLQDDDVVAAAWGAPPGETDQELVKESDLLDTDDLKHPAAAELRVCGTTGVRRACADCSCGLAEELAGEKRPVAPSSCGSCYLGDAFRCSTCPYLGMPAFQPGEKVMLADLRSDL